ncbi:MAG: GAF domain-containing protein [Micromonosporaceae bacterium]
MSQTTPPASRELRLLRAFVELADTLVDDYDIVEMLHRLVGHCVELLNAAAGGLMLADQRGSLQVVAASTERTRLLELFQLQTNEGPCLHCFRTGEPVHVVDLSAAIQRWPRFASEATQENFLAVQAVPLRLRDQIIGALNLFFRVPTTTSEPDLQVARALASTATMGILQERAIRRSEVLTEQLQTALNNRITIEQAKGVLAHAEGVEMEEAFETLRTYSRGHSLRLSEVARRLVTGGLAVTEFAEHPRRGAR